MSLNQEFDYFPQLPARLGDFRVIRVLGKGGMGCVYEGEQIALERKVAIKLLKPDLAGDVIFVERFRREAKAAASFVHRNLVKVYKAGEAAGLLYFAMEFIDGKPVSGLLGSGRRIPVPEAVRIVTAIADALRAGLKQGIIHRDLKPENILLAKDGTPKLADLGLAKRLSVDAGMTGRGAMMGTPAYMAPEQAQDAASVDHRADIYSLGITLFHMVTGVRPFGGTTPLEVALAHAQEPLPSALDLGVALPARLESLIQRMAAKQVAERPESYDVLIADLGEVMTTTKGAKRSPKGAAIKFQGRSGTAAASGADNGIITEIPTSEPGQITGTATQSGNNLRSLWMMLGACWLLIVVLLVLRGKRNEAVVATGLDVSDQPAKPIARRVVYNDGKGPAVTMGITRPLAGQTNFPPLPMAEPPMGMEQPIGSFESDGQKLEKARHYAQWQPQAFTRILRHYDQIWRESRSADTKAIVENEVAEIVKRLEAESDAEIENHRQRMQRLPDEGKPRRAYDAWVRFPPRLRTFKSDLKIYCLITNHIPLQYRRLEKGFVPAPGMENRSRIRP